MSEKVPLRFSGGIVFFICIDISDRKFHKILSSQGHQILFFLLLFLRHSPKDMLRWGVMENTEHQADFPEGAVHKLFPFWTCGLCFIKVSRKGAEHRENVTIL